METFVLTTKKRRGKAGGYDLLLEMRAYDNGARHFVAREWKVPYTGAEETKPRTVLKLCERRGVLINAAWADAPRAFDGSAREFVNFLFDRGGRVGDLTVSDHSEGMRVAMAFALAGRCNTVGRMHAVVEGLTNLPTEAVLYWFTLCFYGQRQKAGKAALFTLLTAKG